MQFRNECELVCDKAWNREFVRKKAEDDENHADEECYSHDKRIAQWDFRLVQCKGERDKETQEHRQQPLDAGEQNRRNRLTCLVELLPERKRLYGIAAEPCRERYSSSLWP